AAPTEAYLDDWRRNRTERPAFGLIVAQAFGPGDERLYFSTNSLEWDDQRLICADRNGKEQWNVALLKRMVLSPGSALRVSPDGEYVLLAATTHYPSEGFIVLTRDGRIALDVGTLGENAEFHFENNRLIVTTNGEWKEYPLQPPPTTRGAEVEWGEAVEGVQVRLRAEKREWQADTVPVVYADVRNQGTRDLQVMLDQRFVFQLELDGEWYLWLGGHIHELGVFVAMSPFPPQRQYADIPITLVEKWRTRQGNQPLTLRPGRHTVRVAFTAQPTESDKGQPVRAVSNAVEIEIPAADSSATRPGAAPAMVPAAYAGRAVVWGQPVDGIQMGIALKGEKRAFRIGERVEFACWAKNSGDTEAVLTFAVVKTVWTKTSEETPPQTGWAPVLVGRDGKPSPVSVVPPTTYWCNGNLNEVLRRRLAPREGVLLGTVRFILKEGEFTGDGHDVVVYAPPGRYRLRQTLGAVALIGAGAWATSPAPTSGEIDIQILPAAATPATQPGGTAPWGEAVEGVQGRQSD
ncbi:MAG: hypothetical protein AMS14_08225, partial [Planctomycetes bacterium DG_20]